MAKLVSLSEAVSVIADGALVATGGLTLYRRPVAAAAALVRRGLTGLRICSFTCSFETELLIAGGCVAELRTCYAGLDFLGAAPLARAAIERGAVGTVEETEISLVQGLRAAAEGLRFLPFPSSTETDVFRSRSDVAIVNSPDGYDRYVAWPAIIPDVALIHASRADRTGNVELAGGAYLDRRLAQAAKFCIVTAEEIVPTEALRGSAEILAPFVDAVVAAPGGARPTSCYPHYPVDVAAICSFLDAVEQGRTPEYLAEEWAVTR